MKAAWLRACALAVTCALAPSGARAGEPSIDATVTIEVSRLPAKDSGLRDLVLIFGKEPAEGLRGPIEAELRDLEAFREIVAEGGEFRLDVQILAVRRHERQLGGVPGETPDSLEVSLESLCTWTWGDSPPLSVPLNVRRRNAVDSQPRRAELESMLTALLRETGQRAFSELYQKHFHRRGR